MAFADEHVVADTDHVSHEGNHVGGLTDGFTVGDLGFLFIQVVDGQAQQVAGGSEGKAGACRVIAEDGNRQTGIPDAAALVPFAQVAEGVGDGEDGVDLVIGLVPCPIKVTIVHVVDVQFFQMIGKFVSLRHYYSL